MGLARLAVPAWVSGPSFGARCRVHAWSIARVLRVAQELQLDVPKLQRSQGVSWTLSAWARVQRFSATVHNLA